jgi:hypothetical protein
MTMILDIAAGHIEIPARVLKTIFDRAIILTREECWPFTKSLNSRGYGQVGWSSDGKAVVTTAHRVAWTAVFGPLSRRDIVRQKCRTRPCINPGHLERVRCVSHSVKGCDDEHCPSGHRFGADNDFVMPDGSRTCRCCILVARRERSHHNELLEKFYGGVL